MAFSLKGSFNDTAISRPKVYVVESPTGYQVSVQLKNPDTARLVTKTFAMRFGETQKARLGLSESVLTGLLQSMLNQMPAEEIASRYTKQGLSSLSHHFVKKLSRRKVYEQIKKRCERETATTDPRTVTPAVTADSQSIDSLSAQTKTCLASVAVSLPSTSAFQPEPTGITYAIIGKSFSGKTHFIVQELNKLSPSELKEYNAIFFFTESTSADPLKALRPDVKRKMIVMDRFCPTVLRAIKRLNDGTHNQFKFMCIFDDIIELRGNLLTKSILTLRNSNISTIISIQYEKLLSPAQRSSVHNMYLFNLRSESWEYMLKGYLLGNFKEKIPCLQNSASTSRKISLHPSRIAQILRENLDNYIIYYDQRKDILTIYHKFSSSRDKKRTPPKENEGKKE